MTKEYRSLDRSTHTVIFLASLLIATSLMGSVSNAFEKNAPHVEVLNTIEEVVVQG